MKHAFIKVATYPEGEALIRIDQVILVESQTRDHPDGTKVPVTYIVCSNGSCVDSTDPFEMLVLKLDAAAFLPWS